jgi:DNA-binding NarL/FixJ family response regulator
MRRYPILLTDGNPFLLGVIDRFLRDFPEIKIVTRTGASRKALEVAGLPRPELVITNLITPEVTGIEAARRLAVEAEAACARIGFFSRLNLAFDSIRPSNPIVYNAILNS